MQLQFLATALSPLGCGLVIIATFLSYVVYQCYFSPLAAFPGPFLAKLTNIWRAYTDYHGQWHREILRLHKKHGSVVRIGPNELSVGDPSAFRTIYKIGGSFPKAESYAVAQGSRKFDLTGERNERIHSEQRRLVARAYTMESVVNLEPRVDVAIKALIEKLNEQCGRYIDLGPWLQLFSFDVIGSVSFSRVFGYIEAGDDKGVFERIRIAMSSISWLMRVPWFFHLHQRVMPIIGNWLAANDRNGYFFQFARREVLERKERTQDSDKDIVGQLFQAQKLKPELTDTDISFTLTSNVFAGSDTTSISLFAIIYLLLKHPAKMDRFMSELLAKRANGELSDPVSFQQAESWPYLQAVMYEAIRVYSPAGFNLDRVVPAQGLTIGDKLVPPGTVVGTSPWVIHRSSEVWGDDAEEFRPERWLDIDKQGDYKRFFFGFGGGSRTCIGRNISWLEIGKVIPTLFIHYDMRLADDVVPKEQCGTLVFLKGLKVQLTPRGA